MKPVRNSEKGQLPRLDEEYPLKAHFIGKVLDAVLLRDNTEIKAHPSTQCGKKGFPHQQVATQMQKMNTAPTSYLHSNGKELQTDGCKVKIKQDKNT